MTEEKDKNQKSEDDGNVLKITINGKLFEWREQYITGLQIRNIADIPQDDDILLAVKKPWEDELITNDKQVNLARPEIEHFYSRVKHHNITLVVNGRQKPWSESKISFDQVVVLAFDSYTPNANSVFTVTYDRGPHENPEGSMVVSDCVFVKNKMIFNVTCTDKS